ncbi:MAG TPA: type II toxin-antitoxin system VapC family toxin [Candidatus Binatus sp.]|jgi:tRNA(fMet)-specific endonuclease VapC|nr:type II toxin-antitoxin system VapC family toxin [Candidatus Binatus sp.]
MAVDFRYLLDTNICIYIRKKKPERVSERFRKVGSGEVAISVITYGELLYGANKSAQRARSLATVQEFVRIVPPLPLPEDAAETYGFIRAELEGRGEMVEPNDLWIAAHALALGLTLVTNDEREFRRVRGLKIQNWAA